MTDISLTEVRGESFTGTVDVDDRKFTDCAFNTAQLRYGGGQLPEFHNCTFAAVSWYFHDAALRTIQLLQMQNLDGESEMIKDIFRPGNVLGE